MAAPRDFSEVTAGHDRAGWCLLFLEHLDEFARLAWYLVADAKLVEVAILRTMVRLDEISFDDSSPTLAYSQAREVLIQQSIALLELEREAEVVPMPPTMVEFPNLVRLAFILKLILRSPESEWQSLFTSPQGGCANWFVARSAA
jgi:hypothetical protein